MNGDSPAFVVRLQANDDTAYNELVCRYHAPLFRLACRMIDNSGEASEVVQDVFLKVFRSIRTFRGDSALSSWIFRVAVSHILNHIRWRRRRGRFLTVSLDDIRSGTEFGDVARDLGPTPENVLESAEMRAAVQAALNRLTDDRRAILILRDMEGLSYEEIAGILGVSVGTVSSRLARARADMRRELASAENVVIRREGHAAAVYGTPLLT